VIRLDEEEKAHEELEKACNEVNGSIKRVQDWTVFLIEKISERYLREGKVGEDELRKICRKIRKKRPQHKRQIQCVFDWKNPITGVRPYRKFKGRYGEEDEAELRIVKSGLPVSEKATYDTFPGILSTIRIGKCVFCCIISVHDISGALQFSYFCS
jgi:hypothetical protein